MGVIKEDTRSLDNSSHRILFRGRVHSFGEGVSLRRPPLAC